jgi:hypothetical protein
MDLELNQTTYTDQTFKLLEESRMQSKIIEDYEYELSLAKKVFAEDLNQQIAVFKDKHKNKLELLEQ